MKNRNIREVLADEAEQAEQRRNEPPGPMYRTRPAREPAQVYSVRMPTDRLEQLRQLAEREGLSPSTLMRNWVLERLDQEIQAPSVAVTLHVSPDAMVTWITQSPNLKEWLEASIREEVERRTKAS